MLEFKDFSLKVENKEILKNLNLKLDSGIYLVIGPNGVGKTTLANSISGFLKYNGEILFKGKSLKNMPVEEISKKGIFLGYQQPITIFGLRIRDYLNLLKKKFTSYEDLDDLIKKTGLKKEHLNRSLNYKFSGGEKKRLELLQMLLINPKLAVLDEIDSGIDLHTLHLLANVIKEFAKKKEPKLILLITHSKEFMKLFNDAKFLLFSNNTIKEIKKYKIQEIEEKGF